jgi:hypothetical protein
MAGLILAFDLDQTLIDSDGTFEELDADERKPVAEQRVWDIIHERLNMTLIKKVLVPAVTLRDSGTGIDAICLLTNNSSREYVANITLYLMNLLNSKGRFNTIQKTPYGNSHFPEAANVFDYVMVRQHGSRNRSANPPKSLKDIAYMATALGIPYRDTADLARRTFFFDDNTSHRIRQELSTFGYPTHYTLIQGPDSVGGVNKGFVKGKPDLSDYRYIDQVFRRILRGEDPVPVAPVHVTVVKRTVDRNEESKINRLFMESGVTKEQARSYLEKAGWDTETAEQLVIADMEKAKSASVAASLPPHLRGSTTVPAKTLHTIAESMKPTSGGRRKKTINNMKRLRTIYAKKLTRRRR